MGEQHALASSLRISQGIELEAAGGEGPSNLDLGFRVQGLGFRVSGLGIWVVRLQKRVWGLGFRIDQGTVGI